MACPDPFSPDRWATTASGITDAGGLASPERPPQGRGPTGKYPVNSP